jgi:hypothetical protein
MLNVFQDQASGLRRLMGCENEASSVPGPNLETLLNPIDGIGFTEFMKRLNSNRIPFLDLTHTTINKAPLDIVSEDKIVMYINQSANIKHLAKTTINHEIGLLISTQNHTLAETIYRNLTHATSNFREISLVKLGYIGLGNTYIESLSVHNSNLTSQ